MNRFMALILSFFALSNCLKAEDNNVNPCAEFALATEVATKIRGLDLIHKIDCLELNKAEFAKSQQEEIFKHITPKTMQHEEAIFKLLGILDSDYDYKSCYLNEALNQTAAFYKVGSGKVIVPSWKPTSFVVLVHEVIHAIQDQYFNLDKITAPRANKTDSAIAVAALTEGEAVFFQNKIPEEVLAAHPEPSGSSSELGSNDCKRQLKFEELSLFPYRFGPIFIEKLFRRFGPQALTQAYENIPESTSAILQSDRYPEQRKLEIELPDDLLQKFLIKLKVKSVREIYKDRLGQYAARLLVADHNSRSDAILAGKGWLGDLVKLYQLSDNSFMIYWGLAFETEKDAKEFWIAFLKANEIESNDDLMEFSKSNLHLAAKLKANRVFLLKAQGLVEAR
ncbi:MAG: hypothetical protein H6619_06485 [Deltaproteobacteria bacterium]|nr:hypothetical protein [Deltaproteobacteria bacterium]